MVELSSTQICEVWPNLNWSHGLGIEVSSFYPGERPVNPVKACSQLAYMCHSFLLLPFFESSH